MAMSVATPWRVNCALKVVPELYSFRLGILFAEAMKVSRVEGAEVAYLLRNAMRSVARALSSGVSLIGGL